MKRSKEELKNRVNELIEDNDIAIQLLEDIEDSFVDSENNQDYEELKSKYDELQKKYRERFTEVKTEDKKEDKKEDKTEDNKIEEVDEKEVVDIKEI